ncbi:hypothetical protein A1OW_10345 [Enterovibrio norvegicus]|uniref:hypothetical protein n=1 Tax=Enterovibrio norvegicus TaxID=188144 RepID=UPI0002F50B7C|nr:hypothetical protein [Enterovibrio norvegicus]OEF50992.1 hypothetical protein A1OW_10345 [Enterovibrio norvegicus]
MTVDAKQAAKEKANKRKKASRARQKDKGLTAVALMLTPAQMGKLDALRAVRGPSSGPYARTEFFEQLLLQEWAHYQAQLDHIKGQCCGMCGDPLPGKEGCRDKGDGNCAQTWARQAFGFGISHYYQNKSV